MDKLTFRTPRPPKTKERSAVVRITPEAYSTIEALSAKTGLSNSYIASRMILFAAQNTEIIYDDEK